MTTMVGPGALSGTTSRRILADGKHLSLAGAPFRAKGVTYGSFAPRMDGELFPERWQLKQDLVNLSGRGLNLIRTYNVPPLELLDLAAELGLRVLVGVDYRDWRYEAEPGRRAQQRVLDAGKRALELANERCAGRPEVLAIAVGNEVPVDVVRVHGIGRVEDGLSELIAEVHRADPGMLATYCNFPTTEFLKVEGLDLDCFNVFLESPEAFKRYLRHLQVISQDRPLIITELGLASNVHGEAAQAASLRWQLKIVDECGAAGAAVFAWTDDWGVDGKKVTEWKFGITTEDRLPKPALEVVETWARSRIRDLRQEWPSISAVVCAYNGDQLIEKCLRSLQAVDYPDFEVVVCDDGSSDDTLAIAQRFPFKVLQLERGGLSKARNMGISASRGDIVAFLDADAFCHPEWPYHLALSLEKDNVVATGGPNLPVQGVSLSEEAVARSPGSPSEVLLGDDRAEHVPGCNMAYKRHPLTEIGCFNPLYAAAGDDVDVCWKLLDKGWEIAFSPAAQVRHHRRDSLRGYLKQQRGYGRAEVLLRPRHGHRFNRLGQAKWTGFVYGGPRLLPRLLRPVIYHGYAGMAAYQPISRPTSLIVRDWGIALMPALALLALSGLVAGPLQRWGYWVAAGVAGLISAFAVLVAAGTDVPTHERRPLRLRALVALMHVLQPIVRTWGRVKTRPPPEPHTTWEWSGDRISWLKALERDLADRNCRVRWGGPTVRWDLEVWRWPIVSWRITTAVLWGWTPVTRVRLSFRGAGLVMLLACGGLELLAPLAGVTAALGLVLAGLKEAIWVRNRLDSAIRATTEQAIDE